MSRTKWVIVIGGGIIALALSGASCSRPTNSQTDNQTPAVTDPAVGTTMPVPGTNTPETEVVDVPTAPPVATKTVTVNYTGSGFSPNTVTINAGDTVRFVNTGQTAAVWPASNPHPIHTDAPGFDARRPLDTGGSYSFTFTRAGTFGYHNHLNLAQTGTVVVR